MIRRTYLIGGLALAAVALVVWRFRPPQPVAPPEEASVSTAEPVSSPGPPIDRDGPTPSLPVQGRPVPRQIQPARDQPASGQPAVPDSSALNERTLVGTKWGRDAFGLEFGPDGKLLIGGRERAQWRVEGSRIRLYRDTTGEEHWLDIVGDKLMWEGQEIGRVR